MYFFLIQVHLLYYLCTRRLVWLGVLLVFGLKNSLVLRTEKLEKLAMFLEYKEEMAL